MRDGDELNWAVLMLLLISLGFSSNCPITLGVDLSTVACRVCMFRAVAQPAKLSSIVEDGRALCGGDWPQAAGL